jgi:hypothetical protein
VQVLHRVGAHLVTLANEVDPEPPVVLVALGQGPRELEVAGLEELQRQPAAREQHGAEREERERRHTPL